jgi:hypothetical protein
MIWTTVDNLRTITGVSTDSYSDGELADFIAMAQREINSKLAIKVIREKIDYIDAVRKNSIDGSNTTFYVKNWEGNFLGDLQFDGDVDINDVIIYQIDKTTDPNTETKLTPASINLENCSFTLSTAPNNVDLYITYSYLPFNPEYPDALLTQAVTFLAASYLFVGSEASSMRFGNVSITSGVAGQYLQYYNKYQDLLNQLQETISEGGAMWAESQVKI